MYVETPWMGSCDYFFEILMELSRGGFYDCFVCFEQIVSLFEFSKAWNLKGLSKCLIVLKLCFLEMVQQ